MRKSKNRKRKDRRAAYNAIMNALSRNVRTEESARALNRLKSLYFAQLDQELEVMDALDTFDKRVDELRFIRNAGREIMGDGWVEVRLPGGTEHKLKSSVAEYIAHRRRGDRQSLLNAAAAEQLKAKAVAGFHPRRP